MANLENSRDPNDNPLVEKQAESAYVEPDMDTPEETAEDTEAAELAADTTDDTATEPETVAEPAPAEADANEPPQRHLSKEASKIVALKRQNQKLLEDYRALKAQLDEHETVKQQQTLKSKYIDEGLDEDMAERQAKLDVADTKREQRLMQLEFRVEHESVLRQYPEAKDDLARIMQVVKTSGMSVEQACRGLYGLEPERDRRARQAAKGELEDSEVETSVAKAQRSAQPSSKTTLTARDLANKKAYEQMWRNGERMSADEYLRIKTELNPFNE